GYGTQWVHCRIAPGKEPTQSMIKWLADRLHRTQVLMSGSACQSVVFLFKNGQLDDEAKDKSDRLSVSENCSLVIKKVTDEDGGLYTCKQFRSGQIRDNMLYLSVATSEYLHHHVFKLSEQYTETL
uniref:Ig-like domain-containing protein n=1 Tax=Cyclopterus lumpus TaxID=8103 RepID=A0A8C2ZUM2_CYCLU